MTTYDDMPEIRHDSSLPDTAGFLRRHADAVVLVLVFALLAIWGAAIALFGYPALIVPLIAVVPVIFAVLILLTFG